MNKTYRFSRSELHELVWSRPISEIAPTLGLSDQGLSKTCARHLIPTPSRGYWAKIAVGMKPKVTPLRPVKHKPLETVVICTVVDEVAATVLAKYRQHAADAISEADKSQLFQSSQVKRKQSVSSNKNYYTLSVDQKPNAAVSSALKALAVAEPDKFGEINSSKMGRVSIHKSSLLRSSIFLNNLANALNSRDISISANEGGFTISKANADLNFNFSEVRRRIEHKPTLEELAKQSAIDEQNRRDGYIDFGGPWNKAWDVFDTVYTGRLCVEADIHAAKIRRSWTDGKQQTIENSFGKIVDGLELLLDYKREKDLRDKAREEEFYHRRRRHQLAKAFRAREAKREEYFLELSAKRREIDHIQIYLDTAQTKPQFVNVTRMNAWLEQRLATLNDEVSPEAVEETLERLAFFPEEDDLHDPLGVLPEDQYP
ncbi:hypothetical protein ACLBWZ_16515 [Brucellaceae bacterium C25G]